MTQAAASPGAEALQQHYLQVLARRTEAAREQVRTILQARLQPQALQAPQDTLPAPLAAAPGAPPDAARCSPLRALVQQLAQPSHLSQTAPPTSEALLPTPTGVRPELKSVQQSRSTWSRLSAERLLAQALGQAPQNAGPINSHMLVLRSLALMRERSPDYLGRFMAHVDTLLCLEASERERLAVRRTGPGRVKRPPP